jgi:hypothetical protein
MCDGLLGKRYFGEALPAKAEYSLTDRIAQQSAGDKPRTIRLAKHALGM